MNDSANRLSISTEFHYSWPRSDRIEQRYSSISIPGQHYAYGVLRAAELAANSGLKAVTIVECGVAEGTGLMNLCRILLPRPALVPCAHGVPFLDISGELAAATRDNLEGYVIPIDRHPNEKGDTLVAT